MNVKKVAVTSMAGLMLGGLPLTSGTMVASANDINDVKVNAEETQNAISEHVKAIADNYIHFNGTVFVLSDDLKNEVTAAEYSAVATQVSVTNDSIMGITLEDLDTTNVTVVDPNGVETNLDDRPQLAANGKNAIKFYWNYARVWISKNTMNNVGTGLSLGGIWIPHPVLKAVAASMGVVLGRVPHGVVFDYNYFIGNASAYWSVRWQK